MQNIDIEVELPGLLIYTRTSVTDDKCDDIVTIPLPLSVHNEIPVLLNDIWSLIIS